jgi:hypothetical protein
VPGLRSSLQPHYFPPQVEHGDDDGRLEIRLLDLDTGGARLIVPKAALSGLSGGVTVKPLSPSGGVGPLSPQPPSEALAAAVWELSEGHRDHCRKAFTAAIFLATAILG